MRYLVILFILFPIMAMAADIPNSGVCVYHYEKEYGCFDSSSEQDCRDDLNNPGLTAEYEKFIPNKSVKDFNCYKNLASVYYLEQMDNIHLIAEGINFNSKIIINDSYYEGFLKNTEVVTRYSLVAGIALISFIIILLLRCKFKIIPFQFSIVISIIVGCLILIISELNSSFHLYVPIDKKLYLLSNIILAASFLYIFLYIIISPLYHYINFRRGKITNVVSEIILFADKAKTKLNL